MANLLRPLLQPVLVPLAQRGLGLGTGGAAVWAPYPAPSGFRWDFVTSNGDRVTSNGEPVVALVEIA